MRKQDPLLFSNAEVLGVRIREAVLYVDVALENGTTAQVAAFAKTTARAYKKLSAVAVGQVIDLLGTWHENKQYKMQQIVATDARLSAVANA